jgi:CO/xanthine dehydrogenase Mo-binding subunit
MPGKPPALTVNSRLNRWIRFNADGSAIIHTGRVEIGQGILTALAQIAAEELDLSIEQVRITGGDTALGPDEGHTSGSRSVDEGGSALRLVCAEARHILLQAAATRLDLPVEKLTVERGVIAGQDRIRCVAYWELPHEQLLDRDITGEVHPKHSGGRALVGTSVKRLDIPDKVMGVPRYVADMELPGMLFGRVVRPPSWNARLESFDEASIRRLPGVVAVVRDGDFLGVVAEREEQAIKARKVAVAGARWREQPLPIHAEDIYAFLESRKTTDAVVFERSDPPAKNRASRHLEARYLKPYIAHAALGPSCAVARAADDGIEVWTHSQGVYPLQRDLAVVLDKPPASIVVHHVEGPGCYGHNGADDAALDAVLLARAVPGRAVKMQWMRDDEFAWEPYGPAMLVKTRAALDDNHRIVDWELEIWSNGHNQRPGISKVSGRTSALLASWHLERPAGRVPQFDSTISAGGGMARNGVAIYNFPNQRVVTHRVEELPLRVSTLRALGAYANVFAIESFMDELAGAAGADPVEFRLRHLDDPRAKAVIETAAQRAGWCAGEESDGSRGRGIGFARYKNDYGYFAVVIDVELEPDLHVSRAVAAVDVGLAVNPDGVKNQVEGGIIQSISWTLKEQLHFDRERVLSRDWETYPILGFPEIPAVEVHLIQRPDDPPLGAGEIPTGPTAAAIGNALAHALGTRIRQLPLTRERIIQALA